VEKRYYLLKSSIRLNSGEVVKPNTILYTEHDQAFFDRYVGPYGGSYEYYKVYGDDDFPTISLGSQYHLLDLEYIPVNNEQELELFILLHT
jgi:hypothetical protein